MSELLREAAQWRKGKTPILSKYIGEHKQLFNAIAGRGFLNLPGYAYDGENQIELAAKMGLSELNYKILAETIERELKQVGIDYNNAYITAALAWELEKQGLMDAWEAELALIKQGMAEEEEVKNRLALEVDARQAVLINAKTALEVQAEGYRKDLAELDAETAPYEVQLANAKLLTAQKKLELIPIIQGIIEKEEQLLGLESSKTAYYTALLNQENEVAAKKQQMLPGLAELATVTRQHAALIPTQIELERQIAEEKVAQAEAKVEVSENDLERIDIEIDTENKNVEISAAKRDLADEQFDNEQELIALKINKEETYQNRNYDLQWN